MSNQKKQLMKCPLGDPKIFCEQFRDMHDIVMQMRAENMHKDMSILDIESRLVFIRDGIDELLAKVRAIPAKR